MPTKNILIKSALKYQKFIGINPPVQETEKPKIIFDNSSVTKKYKFLKKIKSVFIEIFISNYNTDKVVKKSKKIDQKHLLGKTGVIEKVQTLGHNLLTFETDGHSFITGYITDDEIIQENIIE